MIWSITLIFVLTIVAVRLNEPGRFRPARCPIGFQPSGDDSSPLPKQQPAFRLNCVRVGSSVGYLAMYWAADGQRYLFRFGPRDFPQLGAELVALCDDEELDFFWPDAWRFSGAMRNALTKIIAQQGALPA